MKHYVGSVRVGRCFAIVGHGELTTTDSTINSTMLYRLLQENMGPCVKTKQKTNKIYQNWCKTGPCNIKFTRKYTSKCTKNEHTAKTWKILCVSTATGTDKLVYSKHQLLFWIRVKQTMSSEAGGKIMETSNQT